MTSDGRSLTGISGDAGTGTQSFTYDALSRLTGSTGLADSRSYQYDLDGNRTRRVEASVTTDVTYDRADQAASQVIAGTTRTYTYDRYGNLTKGADIASGFTSYSYDEANRLTSITPPSGGAVTFTLDALDRHATRSVGGTLADTYGYLDATETAWQTGTGTPTSALLDADGSRLAVKTGAAVAWLIFDLHGSVTALCTAGTSTITDAYRFDGFGQQIASAGTATNPWRFRGLLNIGADSLTGALLDMGARDYSPGLGVFTQEDSVQGAAANPLTMNRFLYALANPATLIDPDGHRAYLDTGSALVPIDMQTKEPVSTRTPSSSNPDPDPPDLVDPDDFSGAAVPYSQLDVMSVAELQLYISKRATECDPGPFGNPMDARCGDYRYAYCALGRAVSGGDTNCAEYATPSDPIEGLLTDAGLAALALTLGRAGPAFVAWCQRNSALCSSGRETFAQAVARGREFEANVLSALRIAGNNTNFVTRIGVTVRTDSLLRGILEIKDRAAIYGTAQLRGMADLARQQGVPFNLIVSERTTTISQTVQDLVRQTGGTIVRFDPATNRLLPWP